jgi:hypothetical protein
VSDRRLDDVHRIERVAAAVDDEERLVAQVVEEDRAAELELGAAQHQVVAVQRQERGVRRRVVGGDVVEAGRAVGHARQEHAVLVDVVVALDVVEDCVEAGDLLVAPPGRLRPPGGHHVDLIVAGEAYTPLAAQRAVLAHDAAVELDAHLPAFRGIVGRGDDEPVLIQAVAFLQRARRHVLRIGAPVLQPRVFCFERCGCRRLRRKNGDLYQPEDNRCHGGQILIFDRVGIRVRSKIKI